jgi:hypothetical protein
MMPVECYLRLSQMLLSAHRREHYCECRTFSLIQNGSFIASSCFCYWTCRLSSIRSNVDRSSEKSFSGAMKTR